MERFDREPDDFGEVGERLRSEREAWSRPELDQIKVRSMAQAAGRGAKGPSMGGLTMRARTLVLALSVMLIGATVAAGVAATGNGNGKDAADAQYGPPETCPNGQPKPPPGNCGNPPETCPNGQPKPPTGNCGRTPKEEADARAAAQKRCIVKLRSDRRVEKKAKARHRRFMSKYHGAKRQRLAKKFSKQEKSQHSRTSRKYKSCKKRASQA
jgi:hypothetical protein